MQTLPLEVIHLILKKIALQKDQIRFIHASKKWTLNPIFQALVYNKWYLGIPERFSHHVYQMHITTTTLDLYDFVNLQSFECSSRPIISLKNLVKANLPNLKELILTRCSLREDVLLLYNGRWPLLENLDISGNWFAHIYLPAGSWPLLKYFDASYCGLRHFWPRTSLTHLSLTGNYLSDIYTCSNLPLLEELALADNNITHIPICHWPNLRILNLDPRVIINRENHWPKLLN